MTPRGWENLFELGDSWRDINKQYARLEKDMRDVFQLFGIPLPESEDTRQQLIRQAGRNAGNRGIENQRGNSQEDDMFRINIYMGNEFNPENVKMSLKDRLLTVEGKREHKSEDGNYRFYEEVSRDFTIPENVDVKELKSVFAPNGILRIEAPLPPQPQPEPVQIPIDVA